MKPAASGGGPAPPPDPGDPLASPGVTWSAWGPHTPDPALDAALAAPSAARVWRRFGIVRDPRPG